ncbi:MAG TPA: hypothetical protein VGJ34_03525 [Gaiellaceae bacterium]
MSRYSRLLFPLMVVVLLVYLASQTLLPTKSNGTKMDYSDFIARVPTSPDSVREVTFFPKSHRIEAELVNGETLKTTYTTDASAYAFEQKLQSSGIRFDSKGTGDSAWWSILTYLLPFALFFGFWIFLMNQVQARKRERPTLDENV